MNNELYVYVSINVDGKVVYEEDISMIRGNLLWYFICDKVLYGSN